MRIQFILIGLFPFLGLCQQSNFTFHHMTMATGLSANHVNTVMQDREGFYWIGTRDGLTRFDGSSCTIYCNRKNYQHSLSNNNCTFLLEDDSGSIWVATQYGVNRLNKKTNQFRSFYLHSSHSLEKTNLITGLTKDDRGNIYITSAGLWRYNIYSRQWKSFLHDDNNSSSPPGGSISAPQYDSLHHGLWMSGEKGFIFFDERKNKFYHAANNPNNVLLLSKTCGAGGITLDAKMRIWFRDCENGYLCYYDTRSNTITSTQCKIEHSLHKLSVDREQRIWMHFYNSRTRVYDPSAQAVNDSYLLYRHQRSSLDSMSTDVYTDNVNNYWVSSHRGVSIFNPAIQPVQYFVLPGNNENEKLRINCVAEEKNGNIWMGTNNGLFQFSNVSGIFKRSSFQSPVRCFAFVDNKTIWISNKNKMWEYDILQKKIVKEIPVKVDIRFIKPDSQNKIWVGTVANGLYKFSRSGELLDQFHQGSGPGDLSANAIIGISNINNNNFWIGYNGGYGFGKFNAASETWDHYMVAVNNPSHSPYNSVSCIVESGKETVWLGTSGGGIVCYNPRNEKFELFTESDGLRSGHINSLLPDDSAMLWVSTNNGLTVIDTKTKQFLNPDIDLTLPDDEYVSNGIRLKNHHLLFFAGNTLTDIDAGLFFRQSASSKIFITSLKVFNKEKFPEQVNNNNIQLPYNENFFSVEYSLLSALSSVPVHYAYMLEGFDKSWNDAQERRIAYYTNVPAGNYTFRVKATDATGRWKYFSEPFNVVIHPPFWQRTWFIGLAILVFIIALYVLYDYRIRNLKKVYMLRSNISKDLHDEVASTLSGIRLYSEMAKQQLELKEQDKAYHSLEVISENSAEMMQGMSDIVWTIDPGNDSFSKLLQKLKNYAQQITRAAKIGFTMNVDDAIPEEKLNMQQRRNIYLICKEAINNAVKYSHANEMRLSVKKADSAIELLITDNGIGFSEEKANGNGLVNMRLRAKEIGANLEIHSEINKGTVIDVTIRV